MEKIKRYLKYIRDLLILPFKYKRSIWFLFRKKGIGKTLNFLFVKYFVSDEGGDMAVLNNIIATTKFSSLLKYPFKLCDIKL